MDSSEQFLYLAQAVGISTSSVERQLTRLHPPKDMSRLQLVLENLQEALASTAGFDLFSDFPGYYILNFVKKFNQALTKDIDQALVPEWFDRSTQQRGIIDQHPEWACLILSPGNPVFNDQIYRQHQSIVIRCAAIQRSRHKVLGSEIENACRDLRKIAAKRSAFQLPSVGPEVTLRDYWRQLYDDNGSVIPFLSGIELLVRKVIEGQGKSRNRGEVAPRQQRAHVEVHKSDEDDHNAPGPQVVSQLLHSVEEVDDEKSARAGGLHPFEKRHLTAVSVRFSQSNSNAGFSAADHIRRNKANVQRIAAGNQRLPFRYAQLSSIDLATAEVRAGELIMSPEPIKDAAGLLLMLMIWLGRPPEEILSLRLYPSRSCLPKNRKGLLAYVEKEKAFVLPIPSPIWKNNLSEDAKTLLHKVGNAEPVLIDEVILVACPVKLHIPLIRKRFANEVANRKKFVHVFPAARHVDIFDELRVVISDINKSHLTRLTPLRMTQALFDEITTVSSDWVDAYLLTGQKFTTTEVAAHYYVVDGLYLQNLYHSACVSLHNRLYFHLAIDESRFYDFEQKYENQGDYGSKLNPKPFLIKTLSGHLKHAIREKRLKAQGEDYLRQTHNALVSYIALWILFSSGYRAVNDLVFRLREIDWVTGFIVISDKDNESFSNSRVVWLLPQLREQLKQYVLHLEVLQTKAAEYSSLFEHIEEVLSHPHPNASLLFFLGERGQVRKLSPENLRDQFPEFSLPINLGRHYLRSSLRALGCPGEYVNAFLGHWQKGQEPFGRFSTITPLELFRHMASPLEKLRREGGWTVQTGLNDDL